MRALLSTGPALLHPWAVRVTKRQAALQRRSQTRRARSRLVLQGRDTAAGRGAALMTREFIRKVLKKRLAGLTFIIQVRAGGPWRWWELWGVGLTRRVAWPWEQGGHGAVLGAARSTGWVMRLLLTHPFDAGLWQERLLPGRVPRGAGRQDHWRVQQRDGRVQPGVWRRGVGRKARRERGAHATRQVPWRWRTRHRWSTRLPGPRLGVWCGARRTGWISRR